MSSFLLDWHVVVGIASGVLSIASVVPYVRDMLKGGETKPNAVSFFLWTLLEFIALLAQIKSGASWSVIVVIAVTFNTGLVTVLALIGYGYREYGKIDIVCFLFAILAIILWQVTGQPVLAIVLAIVADAFAAIPTLIKTYKYPHSEQLLSWGLVTGAGLLGIFSTDIVNAANLAYPIYLFLMNGAIFSLAYFGRDRGARVI